MSLYRNVQVCCFCAQYFDPDSAEGITYPTKQSVEEYRSVAMANDGLSMTQFFDNRYIQKQGWSLKADENAKQSRLAARKALQVYNTTVK